MFPVFFFHFFGLGVLVRNEIFTDVIRNRSHVWGSADVKSSDVIPNSTMFTRKHVSAYCISRGLFHLHKTFPICPCSLQAVGERKRKIAFIYIQATGSTPTIKEAGGDLQRSRTRALL